MLLRWNATVRPVTNSAAPASWLVRPAATRRATASSCGVRSKVPPAAGGCSPAARSRASHRSRYGAAPSLPSRAWAARSRSTAGRRCLECPRRPASRAPRGRTARFVVPAPRRSRRHATGSARHVPGSSRRRTAGAPPGAGSRPRAGSPGRARAAARACPAANAPGTDRSRARAGTRPETRDPSPCGRSAPRPRPHRDRRPPSAGRRRPR